MEYTRRLELRIDRLTLEKLDEVRGDVSRSAWLRERVDWAWRDEQKPENSLG